MCVCKTTQNTINQVIGTSPVEILGPNPRRKSFLFSPIPAAGGAAHAISMSFRNDVVVGAGVLNYVQGAQGWLAISDNEIGSAIGLPWYIVCGDAGTSIQITEFLYELEPEYTHG